MSERFDDSMLPQAALSEFMCLNQKEGENIQEWADRILKLAPKAFASSDPDEIERQVVAKFSVGLADKEAARFIQCQQPDDLRKAIRLHKLFLFSSEPLQKQKTVRIDEQAATAPVDDFTESSEDKLSITEKC